MRIRFREVRKWVDGTYFLSSVVETFLIGKGSNTESFVPRDSEFPIKNSVGGDSIEDWHWKNRIYPIDTRWDILDICKWLCWCLT